MSRESEYRGKRIYDKKWIYGNLITDKFGQKHIVENHHVFEDGSKIHINNDVPIFFEQTSIGEFTGETDKDNTKIYEQDIITIGNRSLTFIVEWMNAGFVAKPMRLKQSKNDKNFLPDTPSRLDKILKEQQCIPLSSCKDIQVIGNLYDYENEPDSKESNLSETLLKLRQRAE